MAIEDETTPDLIFLNIDARVPSAIREPLTEAEGCLSMIFLIAATACTRQAVQALIATEQVTGPDHRARIRQLAEKHPAISRGMFVVVAALGQADERLSVDRLRVLIIVLKAIVYEIYVLGPERQARLAYVEGLLNSLHGGEGASSFLSGGAQETPLTAQPA